MLWYLTIIFPLAVALFALIWTYRWAAIRRQAVPDAEARADGPPGRRRRET